MLITDQELLNQYALQGNSQAFEDLVRRHAGLVMGVCRNMLLQPQDAEDAFQATFLILSKKSKSLLRHPSLSGWLYQTAVRNCLQIRRRLGKSRETEMTADPTQTNEPWEQIAQAQENELVFQEINRLPKRYKAVIVLCHLEGHSRSEAAEMLNWTESAVKAALARARNLLRKRLIKHGVVTSTALAGLHALTQTASAQVTDPLILSTLQHCQGLSPTVEVGSGFQTVQSLASQGTLTMQNATVLKSLALVATLFAIIIPLSVVAQPDNQPEPIEVNVAAPSENLTPNLVNFVLPPTASTAESEQDSYIPPASTQPLEPGEIIQIESPIDATLKRTVTVQADHTINVPLAGLIQAKGLTPDDLASQLNTKYSKYIKSPEMFVARIGKAATTPRGSSEAIQPGERLLVESLADTTLNHQTTVTADRFITLPLIGYVNVADMNPNQIGELLNQKYAEFIKEPNLFITRLAPSKQIPAGLETNLKPGDTILVRSPVEETLNFQMVILADSSCELPLVGNLSLRNMNLREAKNKLTEAFAKFVKDPLLLVERVGTTSPAPPASNQPVRPGNSLSVFSPFSVFDSSGTFHRKMIVQADNTIALPIIGTHSVQGLTTADVASLLNEEYSDYFKEPRIQVVHEASLRLSRQTKPSQ